jgi:hypothetical protein
MHTFMARGGIGITVFNYLDLKGLPHEMGWGLGGILYVDRSKCSPQQGLRVVYESLLESHPIFHWYYFQ